MKITANSIKEYLNNVPKDRKEVFGKLYRTIKVNIPDGFQEEMNYGMPSWVVSHKSYPNGYHCNPELPLPFLSIANQKNFIAIYHMGIYANPELHEWFISEYPKHSKYKLDMGKSCLRLKRMNDIPFDLIAELVKKMSVKDWIKIYEDNLKQ